ncbi:peptide ABC transporter substrate-binding protein [Mesorhizobium sp. SARCC-RB16n]|uniref:ABC transporter substrate-binding protein n=1 Tax=Mesorhizobium sp. SARCC-RB16n TaxID=2116687 RepID=UPI00122F40F3|nr:ABC transporter substrate-binding protein [Mesorhizobium sp. SARCC-RB16n]KAA3448146.1 peptide ABC transporter substrate-binding protein [Mesorhizobium sp. SARCC-RB16n]
MTISRREVIKAGMAAGTALSFPSMLRAQTSPEDARTVRMAKEDLRIFDPVASTANITQEHGLAIYDTLFALDSKLTPQPQMIGKWGVSDDKKTYTFELRDGLGWHDGGFVTAADCVASIRRWGQVDAGGQLILARAKDISKKDDKTFTIALKEPLGLLPDILASASGQFLFIMREQDANRPATEQVTANIGSGPFRFNAALAKPGSSVTYDRNEKYVPRKEAPSAYAGGKIAKVDRVIWNNIADQQTAFAALQAGEIDFFQVPADLYPAVESDPNLDLQVVNKSGNVAFVRMNCLQKPFDNIKARQAILNLIDQEAMLRAMYGDPKYIRTVTSMFGNDTPASNDENTAWFKKGGDPEKAKQLFKEAGYAGEKVVILQPTDWASVSNGCQVLASALRNIGVNAELAPSDWGGVATRRSNKGPVEDGGWSMFLSDWPEFAMGDPISNVLLAANGEKAWYGWPKNDEYEALRAKWANVATSEERKALARKMQRIWWDFAGFVLIGQSVGPIAHRKTLTGLLDTPGGYLAMWNMQKASA